MHVDHGLGIYLFSNATAQTDEHAQQRDLIERHAPDQTAQDSHCTT
jgi:hypothetical protein